MASEEYASRLGTPPVSATGTFKTAHSNTSQPHVESPLRKASFPVDPDAGQVLQKTRSYDPSQGRNESALESETEDEGTHVAMPSVRKSKYTGNGYDPPTQDLGPEGGNTTAQGGYVEETGYGVPILASDEVAKTPGLEYMQPAVSPVQERRGSNYYTGVEGHGEYQSGLGSGSRPGSAANSRPSSRPGSIHSISNLSRFSTHDEDRENMHTPLEDVDEYEPLFPDEDGNKVHKPITPAQRLKMRETLKRFPSQDIWEDTPKSLQLQATVETPEGEMEKSDAVGKAGASNFETAEQEAARKGEVSEAEKAKLIPRDERLAKSNFQPHIQDEMRRPTLKQRFPSKDIWEDSPDSAKMTTTVGKSPANPPDAGLEAGAVVQTSGAPADGVLAGVQSRDNAIVGAAAMTTDKPSIPPRPNRGKPFPLSEDSTVGRDGMPPPSIPARPPRRIHQVPPADAQIPIAPSKLSQDASKQTSPTENRKPELSERPKPQIPSRPNKSAAREPPDTEPLAQVTSASSGGSEGQNERDLKSPPSVPKSKPAIPARPPGGKIASLKAGFMGDLESRLKLGPQAPKPQEKEPEPEAEPKTLEDARKGRAKGPAKRRPVPTAPVSEGPAIGSNLNWKVQQPWTVWSTDGTGAVEVGKSKEAARTTAGDSIGAAPISAVEEPKEGAGPLQSKKAPVPNSSETAHTSEGMQQAKQKVDESLRSADTLMQRKVEIPTTSQVPGSFPSEGPEPSETLVPSKETTPTTTPPSSTLTSTTTANEEGYRSKDIAPATALAATSLEESHTKDDSFAGEKHASDI